MPRVKVSVYVPADLHRRAKYVSFEQGTTIQNVVEGALQRALCPDQPQVPDLKPKEIQMLMSQLRKILQSGNELFITNCVSCIRGTFGLLEAETRNQAAQSDVVPIQSSSGNAADRRRKREKPASHTLPETG
jgi:hypothetical protein